MINDFELNLETPRRLNLTKKKLAIIDYYYFLQPKIRKWVVVFLQWNWSKRRNKFKWGKKSPQGAETEQKKERWKNPWWLNLQRERKWRGKRERNFIVEKKRKPTIERGEIPLLFNSFDLSDNGCWGTFFGLLFFHFQTLTMEDLQCEFFSLSFFFFFSSFCCSEQWRMGLCTKNLIPHVESEVIDSYFLHASERELVKIIHLETIIQLRSFAIILFLFQRFQFLSSF